MLVETTQADMGKTYNHQKASGLGAETRNFLWSIVLFSVKYDDQSCVLWTSRGQNFTDISKRWNELIIDRFKVGCLILFWHSQSSHDPSYISYDLFVRHQVEAVHPNTILISAWQFLSYGAPKIESWAISGRYWLTQAYLNFISGMINYSNYIIFWSRYVIFYCPTKYLFLVKWKIICCNWLCSHQKPISLLAFLSYT